MWEGEVQCFVLFIIPGYALTIWTILRGTMMATVLNLGVKEEKKEGWARGIWAVVESRQYFIEH